MNIVLVVRIVGATAAAIPDRRRNGKEYRGNSWWRMLKAFQPEPKEYLIKRKLMKERYGIDIVEI